MEKPTNEDEFNDLMKEIDSILKSKNIPITKRPLLAFREIALRFSTQLPITGTGPPIPGKYEGKSFSDHVLQWSKEQYGDKLKIDFSSAYVVILIKGDIYRLKIPLLGCMVELSLSLIKHLKKDLK